MQTHQELLNLPIADFMVLAGRVAREAHYFADTSTGQALVRQATPATEAIAGAMRARARDVAEYLNPRVDVDVRPWLVLKRPLDVAEVWGLLEEAACHGDS